jgi:hypothetical protein
MPRPGQSSSLAAPTSPPTRCTNVSGPGRGRIRTSPEAPPSHGSCRLCGKNGIRRSLACVRVRSLGRAPRKQAIRAYGRASAPRSRRSPCFRRPLRRHSATDERGPCSPPWRRPSPARATAPERRPRLRIWTGAPGGASLRVFFIGRNRSDAVDDAERPLLRRAEDATRRFPRAVCLRSVESPCLRWSTSAGVTPVAPFRSGQPSTLVDETRARAG